MQRHGNSQNFWATVLLNPVGLKIFVFLLSPFICALAIFYCEYFVFEPNFIQSWGSVALGLLKHTSIYRTYSIAHEFHILCFAFFWLIALPLFAVMVAVVALKADFRTTKFDAKKCTGAFVFVFLGLMAFFKLDEFYLTGSRHNYYSPGLSGVLWYAFTYELICFFGIIPGLFFFHYLFTGNEKTP